MTTSDGDSGDGAGPQSIVTKKRVTISCNQWKEIVEGFSFMEDDVRETRKSLLYLQGVVSE